MSDVRVGSVQRMSGGVRPMDTSTPPAPPPPMTEEELRQQRIDNIIAGTGTEAFQNPFNFGGFLDPIIERYRLSGERTRARGEPTGLEYLPGVVESGRGFGGTAGFRDRAAERFSGQPVMEEEPQVTDWLAEAMGMLGGGPDYSAYRASLEDMVLNPETGLSPRLQAMYSQLANEAGANQQRISDIYGGATGNVGAAYDTSAANIADAFTSAQQQGADQMARLGIEEAAGQVIPQAAGQQASALAALEQGRAGGLSALERYGASSGDFASQMGQAAQQRGVEQNEFLLGALQRQLAESLGMEAQGAYDARLRAPGLARDLFEASQLGQPQGLSIEDQIALDNAAFRQGEAGVDQFNQMERLRTGLLEILLGAGFDYEEAVAEVNLQYPRPTM